ncbi:helix-hairpin-helix domain-containing protein [Melaminivora sp.]|uniref:ComEA family DNA-binding protein n=1 Tax=Melaminivora sp. TaxID=1933032 RepID=UPI0028B24EA9|nr:helix-hairpin-helix domain-containing protein [Melaminivora sp.]
MRLLPRPAAFIALAFAGLVHCGAALARVDANHASEAQLDGIKGIGPATSARILAARSERPFADWNDFIARVRGIGPATAARLSDEGLRIGGAPYAAPPAARAPATAPAAR